MRHRQCFNISLRQMVNDHLRIPGAMAANSRPRMKAI
jgi:hypothetical protein